MDENIFDITPQPDPRPEGNCCCGDAYKPLMNRLFDMNLDSDCADNLTSSWIQIRKIIDEGMEKRDRSVSIYIHPENGMSVNVYPWPDYEGLYEMYKDGKITFNDFRAKAGLPMMKEEDFIRSSHRFNIQEIKD